MFFRAGLISLLSVFSAVVALAVKEFIPNDIAFKLGADAVDSVLTIMASSMLAVTTFSLSTIVAAHASVASTATPRATELLLADTTAQTMLSTFIGAFIYSLVGIILLKTGVYGASGRLVLFVVTIFVVTLLVVSLLRWIDFLLQFGRLGETISRVETATRAAMEPRREAPALGAVMLDPDTPLPEGGVAIEARLWGYVQHIDLAGLQECAEANEVDFYLTAWPGARVHRGRPLAVAVGGEVPEEAREALETAVRAAFSLGADRSFDQDPCFGVIVMSEIACRALSPAVNDAGTAIAIIPRVADVIAIWSGHAGQGEVRYPRIHLPAVSIAELFDAFFLPVSRDGAGNAEMQIRMQKALLALAEIGRLDGDFRFVSEALRHSALALERAQAKIDFPHDLERVRRAAEKVRAAVGEAAPA